MKIESIQSALTSVTKKYTEMRKAEERARRRVNRSDYMYSDRVTVREIAWEVMEDAYNKVSDNGTMPANARQIMYAARPGILAQADKDSFGDDYFTQVLLPEYIAEHGCSWDVVYDARGSFNEPHTKTKVALGTLDVRGYLRFQVDETPDFRLDTAYPTAGPSNRFKVVLFIEKEGFHSLFKQVKLAEKWDIAIMSTKGQSVTAARDLIRRLGLPTLVLHDFDKHGFSIFGAMKRGTDRYPTPLDNVIDIGLRLEDVEKYNLVSEPYFPKGDPCAVVDNLRLNGATQDEVDFLLSRRVELNAFTSREFIEFIESKLTEHGVKKVVPDDDTLEKAYRRAVQITYVNGHIEEIEDAAKEHADDIDIPDDLGERVRKGLIRDPHLPWDDVIAELVGQEADG